MDRKERRNHVFEGEKVRLATGTLAANLELLETRNFGPRRVLLETGILTAAQIDLGDSVLTAACTDSLTQRQIEAGEQSAVQISAKVAVGTPELDLAETALQTAAFARPYINHLVLEFLSFSFLLSAFPTFLQKKSFVPLSNLSYSDSADPLAGVPTAPQMNSRGKAPESLELQGLLAEH